MKLNYTTRRFTYLWDTDRPYSRHAERIEVYQRGNYKGNLIDAWGESISSEDEFHAACERREERVV